jgi:hypothetical protein
LVPEETRPGIDLPDAKSIQADIVNQPEQNWLLSWNGNGAITKRHFMP